MKIKSIFGAYADRMQLMIDNSMDKFAPTWFPKYFGWATPQTSLTYVSAIGASRIEAAASVVNRDSQSPLRSRAVLSKLSGEIPAIKEKFKMTESDYREFLTLQGLVGVDDATKKQQMLDFIFNDVKKAGESADKRIDFMVLQAISTGKINVNTTTNPDGLVLPEIDLLMPDTNKADSSVSWATAASAKPLTVDIPTRVRAAAARGQKFSKILMTPQLWWKFAVITEVQNLLSNFVGYKQSGNILSTLENVNKFLTANGYPVIELVDVSIGIEKDGVITAQFPFDENAAVFVPDGQLGTIKNAIPIEKISPVSQVAYANYNKSLISKWKENDPFGEYTGVELNAFPSFDSIDAVHILTAVHS